VTRLGISCAKLNDGIKKAASNTQGVMSFLSKNTLNMALILFIVSYLLLVISVR
jgi:preprotein translocase subunit SecG